ncbi:hypothetical protein L873DRAFT_1831887 [Choiromyces venosus 120613-1]|uniref:GPI anchored protein n=1 Tax=Choiromyces venosus 120613-1 TaxID=1336337 RepID=A0A3N4IV33_9PEZI|nr:hypothetical protein L873DRAFT_1831887 [Choiromyces venosus 120613-1]
MFGRSISLLSSLLLVLLFFTPAILADSEQQFQELVRDVPEDRLHAALHDYNGAKFKHVKLAKRQSNTTTTSRNTDTTSHSTPTTAIITTGHTSTQKTRGPTTTTSNTESTTTAPPATSKRGTTSLTLRSTRTVSGPDGASTFTDVTVVVATPTDESSTPTEGTTSSTTRIGAPGLQNVGLRVSGGDSVIVAVIAALGFFML